jgi:hypothetical protein
MKLLRAALGIAAYLFAFLAPIPAQDSAHRLTAMDEFHKRYANLWIINADGSDHRPLTTGNRSDTAPRWSPCSSACRKSLTASAAAPATTSPKCCS